MKKIIVSGVALILTSIGLGALAAHGLRSMGLPDEKIASFETGVRLQMYAGIGLLLWVALKQYFKFSIQLPFILLTSGAVLFSGSIYLLSTKTIHGMSFGALFPLLTPLGGILMISAWGIILINVLRQKS